MSTKVFMRTRRSKSFLKDTETADKWNREDALRALAKQEEYSCASDNKLIIKFPDPEITKSTVENFSDKIQNAVFETPISPRECTIVLKPNTPLDPTIKELSKIRFGTGKLKVERKIERKLNIEPEQIDPYTLFISNVSHDKVKKIQTSLNKSIEFNVGQAKRKPKAYIFAKFNNIEDSLAAFQMCMEKFCTKPLQMDVRFKRRNVTQHVVDKERNEKDTRISLSESTSSIEVVSQNSDNNTNRAKNNSKTADNGSDKTATGFDKNIEIKSEPDTGQDSAFFMGFSASNSAQNNADSDTDCSDTTLPFSSSIENSGKRRLSSDDSATEIEDDDDDELSKMKRPKLLDLPVDLHGAFRYVKEENSGKSTDEKIEEIDLSFI